MAADPWESHELLLLEVPVPENLQLWEDLDWVLRRHGARRVLSGPATITLAELIQQRIDWMTQERAEAMGATTQPE